MRRLSDVLSFYYTTSNYAYALKTFIFKVVICAENLVEKLYDGRFLRCRMNHANF